MSNSSITGDNNPIFHSIQHIQPYLQAQDKILMSSQLEISHKSNNFALVILTYSHIFVKNSQDSFLISHLNFSIKFQPILQNQQNIKSRKTGFRLIKDNSNDSLSFLAPNHELIDQWIKTLRTLINQVGFHKNFKPIRKLGRGQFATVFEVENLESSSKYAVKAFSKSHLGKTEKGMQSLINEIKIMRGFHHKNLQKLECVYQSENSIYVVTELLKGGTLFDRLQQYSQKNKNLNLESVRQLMQGLLNGLNELSRLKIVHRDLKLDNIMLRDRNSFEPVVIDFGLATFSDQPEYLYHKCGTPGYVSPQVMNCLKTEKTLPISDIFSVGAIFHHLLTRKSLFRGRTPEQVLKSNKSFNFQLFSEDYEQINSEGLQLLSKMLELDPKKRISADEAIIHDFFNPCSKVDSPICTELYQNGKSLRQLQNISAL